MKFGIVLPTWVYNQDRVNMARVAFESLAKTKVDENNWITLLLIEKPNAPSVLDKDVIRELSKVFIIEHISDPSEVKGTEQTLAYGTQRLFDSGCNYVTWMGDDALFNPDWHLKLQKLIQDKPEAKGWSVYRSAYEAFHQTLREEDEYVMVSTLCGHGMTLSKEEWKEWGIDWRTGAWICPYGDTLDLVHAYIRGGEHWTTKVSYIDHVGKTGLHCKPWIPEHAVQFQGQG